MTAPVWVGVVAVWLVSLVLAAGFGSKWEWSALVFAGAFVLWTSMWAAVVALHGLLVPKGGAAAARPTARRKR